jgi:flagellar biosynthesis component FlhA
MLRDCLRREGEGQVELRLPAGIRREILAAARYAVGQEAQVVVLTTPELRPWVYQILKAELPVVVLSYAELLEQVRVEVAGTISVMG